MLKYSVEEPKASDISELPRNADIESITDI
jgi:hypothetical protein